MAIRWTKSVTKWREPVGKRKKGGPCKRWEDDVKRTAGPNNLNKLNMIIWVFTPVIRILELTF